MRHSWLLCLMTTVVIDAGSPDVLRDTSLLRLLNKHYSSVHTPRSQWSYHPRDDFYRRDSQGVSHGYASYPYDSAVKTTETSSEHPTYSPSSQEYWKPSSNYTSAYYGYSRPHLGSASASASPSYLDSAHQYQQIRTTGGSYISYKRPPSYYVKGNVQLQSFDGSGKTKYKKPTLYQSPSGYKKSSYPRVHKPYVKHKYPTRKTIHPLYRRYYQSPYQRYEIPSGEFLRYKMKGQSEGYYKASTASPSPTSVSQRYHTTERMDDAYPEGSSPSEDYSAYNDTRIGSSGNYYETYEEVEKTTSEPEESLYDESTTRGYYGDRIYMSTQVPLVTSDKTVLKSKYYIVRRTSDEDEDIETIFE